jgi:hypothetical protein
MPLIVNHGPNNCYLLYWGLGPAGFNDGKARVWEKAWAKFADRVNCSMHCHRETKRQTEMMHWVPLVHPFLSCSIVCCIYMYVQADWNLCPHESRDVFTIYTSGLAEIRWAVLFVHGGNAANNQLRYLKSYQKGCHQSIAFIHAYICF